MIAVFNNLSQGKKEMLFLTVLFVLGFIFYAFDRNADSFTLQHVSFFALYATAALFISYFLLPRYLYEKKYTLFFLLVFVVLLMVIGVEELVLEKIFFPETRGRRVSSLFPSLVGVLPVIAILSSYKFAWDALIKQGELEDMKVAVKESELQFLKSQINPHFLFNNLNNLYSYALENSPKTPEIILELSTVLRYMLYECQAPFVPLNKELEQLDCFVRLNEMQIEDRGVVNYRSNNISSNYQIAPLILIVFIENAFKHSTASQSEEINIDIEASVDEQGVLLFTCKNSLKELSNVQELPHGIGLQNVKKRLELIYPNRHHLDIKKTPNSYEITLRIELHKNQSV